ncbi:MAG: hypothetical protein GKR94_05780 [Gammaproteobacteria bacterium]|nr:hypothetical protein [Gammaproteobacteria bacterium]
MTMRIPATLTRRWTTGSSQSSTTIRTARPDTGAGSSTTPGGFYHQPEALGASTGAVLTQAGFSETDIAALRAAGALGPNASA